MNTKMTKQNREKLEEVFEEYKKGTKVSKNDLLFVLLAFVMFQLVFLLFGLSFGISLLLSVVFTLLSSIFIITRLYFYVSIFYFNSDSYLKEHKKYYAKK